MDESSDRRVMELVHSCSAMSADSRAKFLEAECNGNATLRCEVELILAEGVDKTSSHALSNHLDAHLPSHYRLLGLVGSGGMAEVFLAEDKRLDRRVAIKFLNDTFRRDPDRMKRFNQEARAASALNHPNILTIHDIGETDGVQYIVSEFVDGETLGTRIGREKLSAEETVEIAIQIASALNAAHGAGIVHRDLKPDNIMLRSDGSVKVVDFGLAKSSGGTSHDALTIEAVTTSPGMILGTPRYMSPEQTRALPLDGRSDIFSFGIIIFEMLTGHSPFGGSNVVDVIAAILAKEPRKITDYAPETPADIEALVYKALQKDREKRFSSVGEMFIALKDIRNELIGSSQSVRDTRHAPVGKATTGYLKWAIVVLVIAVLAGGGWLWFGRSRAPIFSGTMRSVPVTSWSTVSAEAVSAATFSPDARTVAFASTKSGNSEIWIKQTSGGDPVQVTKNGYYNQYPVWSPDGQEIAYFSSRGDARGIWKVAFTGGQESQLIGGLGPSTRVIRWAGNKQIYFQDGAEAFVLDLETHEKTQLTEHAAAGLNPRAIAVSQDGSTLAISVKENGVWKVKTRRFEVRTFDEIASSPDQIDNIAFHSNNRDVFYNGGVDGALQIFSAGPGTVSVQVSSGMSDLALQDVSADGSKLLYNTLTETSDLWSADLNGKTAVVANDVAEEYWPAISPDGQSVAYQSVAQADRPFRGTVFVKRFADVYAVQVSADGFSPVWSPDSQWIAYFRRMGTDFALWKVRTTGADATKLVEGTLATPGYLSVPYQKKLVSDISWSPDGARVLYSVKTDGISNIWSIGADGTGPKMLTTNSDPGLNLVGALPSPDGSTTAFVSEASASKSFRLLTMPSGGGDPRLMFEAKETFRFIGWSGEQLLVAQRANAADTAVPPTSTTLFAISASGAKRTVISLTNAYVSNIHLSKDGRLIAFAARNSNVSEIWIVPTGGGAPRRIAAESDPKILFSELAWSPDGRSVVFGKQTRTNVLSLLTN